ncbi:MAG: glycosyltransferase family 4 protein [Bryobacteraceae bacterium]
MQLQKGFQWRKTWRHRNNFEERAVIHFPYDTLPRLTSMKPDVIISAELGARTLQAAIYRLFVQRTRLVVWATLSEVTELDRGLLRRLLRRLLLRAADAVIVNGSSGARYVARFGVPPSKVFRVPQTTDIQPFLNLPIDRPAGSIIRLLYSGRLVELKGLVPFVSQLGTWAALHPVSRLEMTLVGDGPLRNALENVPRPSNLSLRFLGHVPYGELPGIYGQADILVFPSLADEWGLVAVEAMAAGLPVLGSLYSQAVEDLVVDGKNGWSFRPDEEEEVRSALDRALTTASADFGAIRSQARETVRHLTPLKMAEDIGAALDYACTHRP